MRTKLLCFFSIFTLIALILGGCNEELYDPSDSNKALAYIKRAHQDGLHVKAIESAREFKLKHPYASANMEVDLLIADSYFQLGDYLEATIHYGRFIKLYPSHIKKPYALYRTGMSHWKQAPRAVDRDQAFTQKALKVWRKLVAEFPASTESSKANRLIKEGELRIVGSKKFVANFYCRQKVWHSCALKAQEILEDFSHYPSFQKEAHKLQAWSFKEMARIQRENEKSQNKNKLEKNVYFRKYNSRELEAMAKKAREAAKKTH